MADLHRELAPDLPFPWIQYEISQISLLKGVILGAPLLLPLTQ